MEIVPYIETQEYIVDPYTSIEKLEKELFEYGYVVVKDEKRFYGILTIRDLAQHYHQLAIDCLTPKPPIHISDSLDHLLKVFLESKQMVLPVFDEKDSYIGCVVFRKVLKEILFSLRGYINIEVKNVVGDESFEKAKYSFIAEMLHNTKNPIQTIISATYLIQEDRNREDIAILLNAIRNSAEQINVIFEKLLAQYLENEGCCN